MNGIIKLLIKSLIFLIIIYTLLFIGILLILFMKHFYFLDETNVSITYILICLPIAYYVYFTGHAQQVVINEALDDGIFEVMQQVEINESKNFKVSELIAEKRKTFDELRKQATEDSNIKKSKFTIIVSLFYVKYKVLLVDKIFKPVFYKFKVLINYIKYFYKYFKRLIKSLVLSSNKKNLF